MPKVNGIEIPDAQAGVDIQCAPGGVIMTLRVVNRAGTLLSMKQVQMPWAAVAGFVEENGSEQVQQGPTILS